MSEEEPTWENGEIVRTLIRMEAKIDRMSTAFVTRELHDQQIKQIQEHNAELGTAIADVAASLERTVRDLTQAEKDCAAEHSNIHEAMVTRKSMWQGLAALCTAIAAVGALVGVLIH